MLFRSKAAVERLLAERHDATGFPTVVVRPAAVYGPDDNIPDGEIALFLRLRERRPVLVPHEGLVTFNYGHVDDLAVALVAAATTPAAVGGTFNVTADAVTALHYVRTIGEIVGPVRKITANTTGASARNRTNRLAASNRRSTRVATIATMTAMIAHEIGRAHV